MSSFLLGCFALATTTWAHGGAFAPTLGPAPSGPALSGPLGPAGPVGFPGGPAVSPSTLGTMPAAPDLAYWGFWWRSNRWPYLALKSHVHSVGQDGQSGGPGWYLGEGERPQKSTLQPSEDQVNKEVVPALLAVLASETSNHLVTGAMVALAKIGDRGDPAEATRIESAILPFLRDSSQETRETAAVALGILAAPRAIPNLANLLWDTEEGQKLVRAKEVDYRTRAFAAYGLGLVGARSTSEIDRQLIVSILRRAIEVERTRSADVQVACVISLGLVPLASLTALSPSAGAKGPPPPESSRLAQIAYVLEYLRDEERRREARAQCPVTLARLLVGLPDDVLAGARVEVARELLERVERPRERVEVVQSCLLALGALGTNAPGELDARIRRVLAGAPRQLSDPQARAYAHVALAEAGARFGDGNPLDGIDYARSFLSAQIQDGPGTLQPWAGLAAGLMAFHLQRADPMHAALDPLRRVLRGALEDERRHERLGAYALAAGLARSAESAPRLMRLLDKGLPDDVRGQVAIGLGLLEHHEAIERLRATMAESQYRPELLLDCAVALGLLDDKDVGPQLTHMLENAHSLATQSAIATALGFVGDRRAVTPLLTLLESRLATERARAFAAVALGNVADKEALPWNTKIGVGLNYRAAPATLSDPLSGTGILDIL